MVGPVRKTTTPWARGFPYIAKRRVMPQQNAHGAPERDLFKPPSAFNVLFPKETQEEENSSSDTDEDLSLTPPINSPSESPFTSFEVSPTRPYTTQSQKPQALRDLDLALGGIGPSHQPRSLPNPYAQIESWSTSSPAKGSVYLRNQTAIEKAKESLISFLTSHPNHGRAREEFEECKNLEAKFGRDHTLSTFERERLRQISRNNERRAYNLGREKAQLPLTRPLQEPLKPAPLNPPPPVPAQKVQVEEKEPAVTEPDSSPDTDTEDQLNAPKPFWRYHVCRVDSELPEENQIMGTYTSRSKAEARVRAEIAQSYTNSKLEDLTGVEIRCILQNGAVLGQVIEFETGRSVQLRIERELIEKEDLPEKPIKQKLQCLPTKVYLVTEMVTLLSSPISVDMTDDKTFPRYVTGKEVFVVRKHANKQASREMMAYIVSHLPEDKRFDLSLTGDMDIKENHYLHGLEENEELYDKTKVLVDKLGRQLQVSVKVSEVLVRGPRN